MRNLHWLHVAFKHRSNGLACRVLNVNCSSIFLSLVTDVKESKLQDMPIYDLRTESCLVWGQRLGGAVFTPTLACSRPPPSERSLACRIASANTRSRLPTSFWAPNKPGEVQSFRSQPRLALGMLSGLAPLGWRVVALGAGFGSAAASARLPGARAGLSGP